MTHIGTERELQGLDGHLETSPQGLLDMENYVAASVAKVATGYVTRQSDGDFDEIWMTESARPFGIYATYERIQ